jgi:uncharacterized protein
MDATAHKRLGALREAIAVASPRVIACSGGIDSMLLATLAHRLAPATTSVAHAVSPAVPGEATERVRAWAQREGWQLSVLNSGEFQSEEYLSNPVNRCYYCKSKLYASLVQIADAQGAGATLMSGANTDDLGEYRPGLTAAREYQARHPYIEAGIDKATIRLIARHLQLPFAELPASPCLASRLYTGTRVTAERLRAVEESERFLRRQTGIAVLRCRIRGEQMSIEVAETDRARITEALLTKVSAIATRCGVNLASVRLDPEPYHPGRAFVIAQ